MDGDGNFGLIMKRRLGGDADLCRIRWRRVDGNEQLTVT